MTVVGALIGKANLCTHTAKKKCLIIPSLREKKTENMFFRKVIWEVGNIFLKCQSAIHREKWTEKGIAGIWSYLGRTAVGGENFWAGWAENTRSVKEVQYKLILKVWIQRSCLGL